MQHTNSIDFARRLDHEDSLSGFRKQFNIPVKNGQEIIYFCGNSLGLQPISILELFDKEMNKWRNLGVDGHFEGERPWVDYHLHGKKELGNLLGAQENEVVILNHLTSNLHALLATFYRPTEKRVKVLIEKGAFPSDHFAVYSFVKIMGYDPEEVVELIPIPEDGYVSNDKIVTTIQQIGDELALVLLPGVQYYTGQFFDLPKITKAAHEVGAYAGFDLAHAMGNLPMNLHDDQVDFATWCSYKYLNSGPGNVSGIFIHEKHGQNTKLPRLAGWWGQDPGTRFLMDNVDRPTPSVDGWMTSNVNVMATSIHLSSLKLFEEAGIENLRAKSKMLTGFLEFLLKDNQELEKNIRILTPSNPDERGCQLSIYLINHGKEIFDHLIKSGIVLDWREPNVIRVAPTPMYNTFEEAYLFVQYLVEAFHQTNRQP